MSDNQLITTEQQTQLAGIELQIAERQAELARLEVRAEEARTERSTNMAIVATVGLVAVLAAVSQRPPKKKSLMDRIFG
ncbi:hypothetical protein D3C81_237470 [compost metagenome]